MRRLTAIVLSMALLLGCFALAASAAPDVSRAVTTFYGPGEQGFHWYTQEQAESVVTVDGKSYTAAPRNSKAPGRTL